VPLLIDISVALYSTKIFTLLKNGLWGTLHEARTDVSISVSSFCCWLVLARGLLTHGWQKDGAQSMAEQPALESQESISENRQVPLDELALFFLRLDTTAFGGPAAHIAIMEDELVRRRKSCSKKR
jgi:hypothetical protein